MPMISPTNAAGFSYKKSMDSIITLPIITDADAVVREINSDRKPRRRLKTFEMITQKYLETIDNVDEKDKTNENFNCMKFNYDSIDNDQYNIFETQATEGDNDNDSRDRFMSA